MTISETLSFKVDGEEAGERLDAFLAEVLDKYSRTQIQGFIKNGAVLVNAESKKPSYTLRQGDCVDISVEDEDFVLKPSFLTLDIRYEDENMLVVNKPKSMLTHPTAKEKEDTLVNALLGYTSGNLSDLNGATRPGIVHRLDRNTSGLLMIAKNNKAHEFLAQQIRTKTARRKYLAVVSGNFTEKQGTISFDIGRHKTKPEKMAVVEGAKPSVTHYKVLEEFKGFTYLELELETGRTHQIRVHLSHIGHPIVNDSLYGGKNIKVKTTEQVLQAYSLSFLPMGAKNDIILVLDEDYELKKVLNYLRSKA